MSNPSALGAITYEAESAWGEDVTTTATLRLPIRGMVDPVGLSHGKVKADRTNQYRQGGTPPVLTTMGGSFKTKMYLPGHGSTTSGATSLTALETLLGIVFGNAAVSSANGTTFTGGTATAPTTTASGTFSAGSLCFAGALGDGRGNGQGYAISTHATTTLNLLTGTPVAPSNNDVLYSATNIYPSEAPTSTTVTSCRFLLQTGNLMYQCHGCWPMSLSITGLNPGELPTIEITWGVSWWRYATTTFPSATSTDTSNPSAVAAGSLFVNTVGTATSALRTIRNFTISYALGMVMEKGSGGVNQYQDIVGCRRTTDAITVSWTEDADAATTSPVLPGYGTGTNLKHVLYTSATAAGSRIAFYLPSVAVGAPAIQKIDNNINRLTLTGECQTGATTTNDLTLSAFRMAFG